MHKLAPLWERARIGPHEGGTAPCHLNEAQCARPRAARARAVALCVLIRFARNLPKCSEKSTARLQDVNSGTVFSPFEP